MTLDTTWKNALYHTLTRGDLVAPRGKPTKELMHRTLIVDMQCPVLLSPRRQLSYRFMAAEAYWILTGDDRVSTITPYNQRIAEFSDDGQTFFGAYGPKVLAQLPYVVQKLHDDPDSRQAGLTLWRECPPATKDVPCTVTMFFSQRHGLVHNHVFMRSSDLWLGVPYDVFNFSMVAHLVCCRLNEQRKDLVPLAPGNLYLTSASSHLYEPNWIEAHAAALSGDGDSRESAATPAFMHCNEAALMTRLENLRDTKPGDELRWWENDHG